MRPVRIMSAVAAAALAAVTLSACSSEEPVDSHGEHTSAEESHAHADGQESQSPENAHDHSGMEMEHSPDGGPAPEGIKPASDPQYPVGSQVIMHTDHMPGMEGATATITGAFTTTTYAVDYTPTDGGAPVLNHKWVVQEELVDPPAAPVADGTKVTVTIKKQSDTMSQVSVVVGTMGSPSYGAELAKKIKARAEMK